MTLILRCPHKGPMFEPIDRLEDFIDQLIEAMARPIPTPEEEEAQAICEQCADLFRAALGSRP